MRSSTVVSLRTFIRSVRRGAASVRFFPHNNEFHIMSDRIVLKPTDYNDQRVFHRTSGIGHFTASATCRRFLDSRPFPSSRPTHRTEWRIFRFARYFVPTTTTGIFYLFFFRPVRPHNVADECVPRVRAVRHAAEEFINTCSDKCVFGSCRV